MPSWKITLFIAMLAFGIIQALGSLYTLVAG